MTGIFTGASQLLKRLLLSKWAVPLVLLAVLGIIMGPYLLLGENAFVRIVDNLDSEFVYFCVMKQNHELFTVFEDHHIEQIMNGLPRSCLRSGWNHIGILFYFFSPFKAYVINVIFVRMIGFAGMYLLCRDYIFREKKEYVLLVAAAFSLVSVYHMYGLSVLGLPLVLWAMLNLNARIKKGWSWLIVILFPFLSYLIMIGPFVLVFLGSLGLYFSFRNKRINYGYWLALITMAVLFVISEISLVVNLFSNSGFKSHRLDWSFEPNRSIARIREIFWEVFTHVQSEAADISMIPMYLLAAVAVVLCWKHKQFRNRALLLFAALLGIAVFYTFYPFIQFALKDDMPTLNTINIRRFTMLMPLFVFVLWAMSLEKLRMPLILGVALIGFQGLLLITDNNELDFNLRRSYLHQQPDQWKPSYAHFFAPPLFAEIKKHIGREQSQYRVAAFGMHPSIPQYNGFYSVDSYQNNYSLEYKHRFRPIIAGELEKNAYLKSYFDDWGSRCMLFSDELRRSCNRECFTERGQPVHHLDIRTDILHEFGCEYILSAVEIENADSLNLALDQTFSMETEIWKIWLYKLK